jgi:aminodeoxyfutalosine deaminase
LPRRVLAGRPLQSRPGFGHFLDAFVYSVSLIRDRADVEEAATALFDDLRREGVRYAEVTFSPQSHLRRGMALPSMVAGLGAARRRALEGGGPRISFIADGGRLWGETWLEELAGQLAAFRGQGIVALGLGGEERILPARRFRRAFERAAGGGLRLVAHAGEGTTPAAVREALDQLQVDRIGHGISAASDPALLRRLARRGTVLEICPVSNRMTAAVGTLADHPLARIVDAGVKVALGTDDRTIFGTDLRREFQVAVAECGLPRNRVQDLLLNAATGSFAPRSVKRELRRGITAGFAP